MTAKPSLISSICVQPECSESRIAWAVGVGLGITVLNIMSAWLTDPIEKLPEGGYIEFIARAS